MLLELLSEWIPSIAKLAAVPHFGWEEEELASMSVRLERFPMLKSESGKLETFSK